jgi:hypothetical protein
MTAQLPTVKTESSARGTVAGSAETTILISCARSVPDKGRHPSGIALWLRVEAGVSLCRVGRKVSSLVTVVLRFASRSNLPRGKI